MGMGVPAGDQNSGVPENRSQAWPTRLNCHFRRFRTMASTMPRTTKRPMGRAACSERSTRILSQHAPGAPPASPKIAPPDLAGSAGIRWRPHGMSRLCPSSSAKSISADSRLATASQEVVVSVVADLKAGKRPTVREIKNVVKGALVAKLEHPARRARSELENRALFVEPNSRSSETWRVHPAIFPNGSRWRRFLGFSSSSAAARIGPKQTNWALGLSRMSFLRLSSPLGQSPQKASRQSDGEALALWRGRAVAAKRCTGCGRRCPLFGRTLHSSDAGSKSPGNGK